MPKMSDVLKKGGRNLRTPTTEEPKESAANKPKPGPPKPQEGLKVGWKSPDEAPGNAGDAPAPARDGEEIKDSRRSRKKKAKQAKVKAALVRKRENNGRAVQMASEEDQERLVSYFAPGSPQAKKIDMLRSQILYPFQGDALRTVMITSSVPREGSSLLAANLAISFARGLQQFVMVMDCNLMNPSLHRLLGVSRQPGLTDYLEHGATVPDIMHWSKVEKLSVIPAGRPSHRSAEILATDRMVALVEELRSRYADRYIILDAPPVQTVDDPAVLARMVEGIVFVVLSGSTDRELVTRSLARLPEDKIAGLALNDKLGAVSDASNVSAQSPLED